MKSNIKVKLNEETPEPVELIASSIITIAEAFEKIQNSPLNRRGLVVLIKDETGLSNRDINAVLDSLTELKTLYIKQPPKK